MRPTIVIFAERSSVVWFGGQGSDASTVGIDLKTGKIVHGEGWGIEAFNEFEAALGALQHVARLRNPAVMEQAVRPLADFVQGELASQVAF